MKQVVKLEIVKYPHPMLKQLCLDVIHFEELKGFIHESLNQMNQLMGEANGMGLAANQVGIALRFFIMRDEKGQLWEFINPKIVARDGFQSLEEGCLSLPGARTTVDRSAQVTVEAQDRNGEPFKIGAVGMEAVCIQHEIDHLDGIFYIEKLSRQQRRAILREFVK